MANALLVGNDINSLSPGYDWAELLKDLVKFVGAHGEITDLREQFPLFYEEICIYAGRHNSKSEGEIKQFIADKVQELEPNEIHRDLLSIGITEVLTTNYDFTLERSNFESKLDFKNMGAVAETRYSIFRNFKAGEARYWHIHGDAHNTNSIALGYEHYSGYLQSMRNYVVSGTGDAYKKMHLAPLIHRLRNGLPDESLSWIDVFFTHDIHIVGLGLDFVEIHLWWLLTFRARSSNGRKLHFQNKVFYYYPAERETVDSTKLRFLRANNVIVQPCKRPRDDKRAYYKNVIRKIKENNKKII